MRNWDTLEIIDLLKRAGEVALRYYETPKAELKDDASVVTIADRAVEELLAESFDHPAEGVYMIGEETVASRDESYVERALTADAVWIVDPIDGTGAYANHIPTWGISIGRYERGAARGGAVFNPVLGEVFLTDDDGRILHAEGLSAPLDWTVADLREFEGKRPASTRTGLVSLSQSLAKEGGFVGRNPVQAVCSAVYSLSHLMLGDYLAYATTLKLWDLAGMWPMLQAAGFAARLSSGEAFTGELNEESFLLASGSTPRWAVRGHVVFAPSAEIIDYVLDNLNLTP